MNTVLCRDAVRNCAMKIIWVGFLICFSIIVNNLSQPQMPELEKEHNPYPYREPLTPYVEGSDYKIPGEDLTPDYRIPEPPFVAYREGFYIEENRPYRMSPHFIQAYRWGYVRPRDNPDLLGCYCCTVYKRLTPLGGCAVLTTRHILTTATSTQVVLKDHKEEKSLENILGAWYDIDSNIKNSSMYMTPARIHYHPKFLRPENVNRSHPLPTYYDLALWASTYPFYGYFLSPNRACICNRGSSHAYSYASSTPHGELLFIVGFQYILAWNRKPMPWFKYVVRTRDTINPCPKTEWGWYHCVPGDWAKFGLDSGAALHRCFEGRSWRYDGLIGLNVLSMKLRASVLTHYFIPLDNHPVLDWLYASYMGRLPYEYLDYRFYNTQWKAPIPKPWFWIPWRYPLGVELDYKVIPFNY